MATVYVNDKPVDIGTERMNVIQAAMRGGVFIPHYCWHPSLSVVASCRMCLVEVGEKKPDGSVAMQPRVVPGCQTPAKDGTVIQTLTFEPDGSVAFLLDDQPVLGMGEGGPRMSGGTNWRTAPVEFDRRGRVHEMIPQWQRGAYGSRNPVALLVGTSGWGLFFTTPWGQFDLRQPRSDGVAAIDRGSRGGGPHATARVGRRRARRLRAVDHGRHARCRVR